MNLKVLISAVILISVTYCCAPSLELTQYVVKENSIVMGKSISSLEWQGKNKINVLKVHRNSKDLMSPKTSFVFAVNDTVYILAESNQVKYLSRFFD